MSTPDLDHWWTVSTADGVLVAAWMLGGLDVDTSARLALAVPVVDGAIPSSFPFDPTDERIALLAALKVAGEGAVVAGDAPDVSTLYGDSPADAVH